VFSSFIYKNQTTNVPRGVKKEGEKEVHLLKPHLSPSRLVEGSRVRRKGRGEDPENVFLSPTPKEQKGERRKRGGKRRALGSPTARKGRGKEENGEEAPRPSLARKRKGKGKKKRRRKKRDLNNNNDYFFKYLYLSRSEERGRKKGKRMDYIFFDLAPLVIEGREGGGKKRKQSEVFNTFSPPTFMCPTL